MTHNGMDSSFDEIHRNRFAACELGSIALPVPSMSFFHLLFPSRRQPTGGRVWLNFRLLRYFSLSKCKPKTCACPLHSSM